MKQNTHPKYQEVLFIDSSTGHKFLVGTTLQTSETAVFKGKTYPVCKVPISSSSHPYFVGGQKFVDTEGRVDKFNKKYQATQQKAKAGAQATEEAAGVEKVAAKAQDKKVEKKKKK